MMSFQDQLAADLGVFLSDFALPVSIAGQSDMGIYQEAPDQWAEVHRPLRSLSVADKGQVYKVGDVVEIPAKGLTTSVRSPPIRQGGLLVIPIK